ncbi:hypothetical protein [Rhodoplanes sp. Z2-YC6860]|uniref:hypothetical protein n=1 Tax=Rhodoplanes sp. Z2-YC6860 TaxID=674703 RepID=UPI00082D0E7D|nr:hypothetical protein [Rhodoplanes sp. Z2-YC6860]
MRATTEALVSRFAAAAALACTIVLVSTPSEARPGLRIFSSTSKIISVKSAAAKSAATARLARYNKPLFVLAGGRPAAAAAPPPAPSPFDPSLVGRDASNAGFKADPNALTAASTDCVMKEPAPAADAAKDKENVAAAPEPAKTEIAKAEPATSEPPRAQSARSRSAFLVPVVNRHPLAPRPRQTVICYVQRDGTCAP